MTTGKSVAILGAGPSGLVATKEAILNGLVPTVIEQMADIGGVWNQVTGAVWPSMRTNLSKFTCSFSDFPWSENSDIFPTSEDMFLYLKSYAIKFELLKYIKFNCKVISVRQINDYQWLIQWNHKNGRLYKKIFNYVIVATGFFSTPSIPKIEGLERFKGKILHSKDYKKVKDFNNLNILVVGNSYSGTEIASELASTNKVIHQFHNPYWILERYILPQNKEEFTKLPLDLVFYNRKFYTKSKKLDLLKRNLKHNKYLESICRKQGEIELLKIDKKSFPCPPKVSVSDQYLHNVKTKKINLKRNAIKKFESDKVIFDNLEEHFIDLIIFATGFKLDISFLDHDTISKLQYNQADQLQPLILYNCMFHPEIPNMSFVGMYKGSYFAIIELQAKWSCKIFTNKIKPPSPSDINKGLEEELSIRKQILKPQFPHSDYVRFADVIASELGLFPFSKELQINNKKLYNYLMTSPFIPAHLLVNTNQEAAMKQLNSLLLYLNNEIK